MHALVTALEGLIAFGSAGAVLTRAVRRREDRVAWALLGAALALCVIGGMVMSALADRKSTRLNSSH